MQRRSSFTLAAVALLCSAASAFAQSKPTVAIMYFNNGAIGKAHEELDPLTKGIADMLITELSSNTGIRVVERDAVQKLLEEQKLSQSGAVDKETAVKVGKLLGVHHMIFGGFMTNPKGTMVLNLRSVKVETGEIEFTTKDQDKTENVLELISKVAAKTNAGLKLPDIPKQISEAREKKAEQVPFQTVMLYSRALNAKDAGKKDDAITLFKQALAKFPDYEPAKKELEKLGVKG